MSSKSADDRFRKITQLMDGLIEAHEGRHPHLELTLEERVALLEEQLHDAQRLILHLARASLLQGSISRQLIDLDKLKTDLDAAEQLWGKVVAYSQEYRQKSVSSVPGTISPRSRISRRGRHPRKGYRKACTA